MAQTTEHNHIGRWLAIAAGLVLLGAGIVLMTKMPGRRGSTATENLPVGALREVANLQQLHRNPAPHYGSIIQLGEEGLDPGIVNAYAPGNDTTGRAPYGGYWLAETTPTETLWQVGLWPADEGLKDASAFLANQTGKIWRKQIADTSDAAAMRKVINEIRRAMTDKELEHAGWWPVDRPRPAPSTP